MRIGLDATPLTELSGGVFRYTAELARALARSFPEDEIWLCSDQPFTHPAPESANVKCAPGPKSLFERRWWLWGLPRLLQRKRMDVFHGSGFAVPYLAGRPAVLTLHDLSPWLNPAWHPAADRVRRRTPWLLRLGLATLVITPTYAVRKEAIARFGLAPDRVVAVHHGASELFYPVAVEPSPVPFLLYVGTLEPRKNIGLIIEVWRELRRSQRIDLVLVGRQREDGPKIAGEPGLHMLGMLPDERLPALYAACAACLYPSLYEGFGLPVLEAMQCGAAVFASRDPAVMEVASDAAVCLDVREPAAWVEALGAALSTPDWLTDLRQAALRRAAEFSWERAAHQTREVYKEAVRRG